MEFKKVKLEDVCLLGDGAHSKVERQKNGIPYLTSKNIKQGYLDLTKVDYISKIDHSKLFSPTEKSVKDLRPGDILVGIIGTFGNVYLYKEDDYFGISSSIGILRPKRELILPEFLYFQVKSSFFSRTVEMIKGGSVQGYTNLPTLRSIPVYLPSLFEQKKILDILLNIENKIDLNKKIIKNLEQISQALFKHWFVDFEFPDEKGNPYKTSGGKLVDSELGLIPAQWVVVKLSSITTILKKTFNPHKTDLNKVMHFSLPAYDNNQQPTLDDVLNIKSNKWLIEDNCVIFSKMNPITPRVWLTTTNKEFSSVASSEFVVLKSKSKEMNGFIYNICKSEVFNSYLLAHTTGSTNSRQRVTPTVALKFPIALNDDIIKIYSEKIVGMTETIKLLNKENAHLQQIRNIILPKLMTGEVETIDEVEE